MASAISSLGCCISLWMRLSSSMIVSILPKRRIPLLVEHPSKIKTGDELLKTIWCLVQWFRQHNIQVKRSRPLTMFEVIRASPCAASKTWTIYPRTERPNSSRVMAVTSSRLYSLCLAFPSSFCAFRLQPMLSRGPEDAMQIELLSNFRPGGG